jgi:hypothetical protein
MQQVRVRHHAVAYVAARQPASLSLISMSRCARRHLCCAEDAWHAAYMFCLSAAQAVAPQSNKLCDRVTHQFVAATADV